MAEDLKCREQAHKLSKSQLLELVRKAESDHARQHNQKWIRKHLKRMAEGRL